MGCRCMEEGKHTCFRATNLIDRFYPGCGSGSFGWAKEDQLADFVCARSSGDISGWHSEERRQWKARDMPC
jgi:hypothetical protein